ncbi:MAG: hypothetical protein ACOYL1_03930 [Chlamydiia bacterium]
MPTVDRFFLINFLPTHPAGTCGLVNKFSPTPIRHAIALTAGNILGDRFLRPHFAMSSLVLAHNLNGLGFSNYKMKSIIAGATISTLLARVTYQLTSSPLAKVAILAIHNAAMLGFTKNIDSRRPLPSLESECAILFTSKSNSNSLFVGKHTKLWAIEWATQCIGLTVLSITNLNPVTAITISYPLSTVVKVLAAKFFFSPKEQMLPLGSPL